jgi:hypothetical protein
VWESRCLLLQEFVDICVKRVVSVEQINLVLGLVGENMADKMESMCSTNADICLNFGDII